MAEAKPPPDLDSSELADPETEHASPDPADSGADRASDDIGDDIGDDIDRDPDRDDDEDRVIVERLNGRHQGQKLEFSRPQRVGFGRHPGNQVAFDPRRDLDASSRHAELSWRGRTLVLRDVGSSNGTFVDGERFTEATLEPGAEIAVEFGVGGPRVQIRFAAASGLPRAVARSARRGDAPDSANFSQAPPVSPRAGTDSESETASDPQDAGSGVSAAPGTTREAGHGHDSRDQSEMYAQVGAGFRLIFAVAAVAVVIAAAIAWISLV